MSDAQLSANRANAQLSTGPVTVEGKARSRMNAARHGFYSAQPVLPGENQEDFDALTNELFDELQPADAVQQAMVERLVAVRWKQLRMQSLQAQYVNSKIADLGDSYSVDDPPTTGAGVIAWEFIHGNQGMKNLIDLEIKLDRLFLSLMRELQRLRKHASQDSRERNERNEANLCDPATTSESARGNEAKTSEPANSSLAPSRTESALQNPPPRIAERNEPNSPTATEPVDPVTNRPIGVPMPRDQQRRMNPSNLLKQRSPALSPRR